ncbi:MAG: GNAT family N-acetyltransferase [Chloroflexota bacterium]
MITTDTSMQIRRASEIERQAILYRLQIEKMIWEDIHPERTRFFVAVEDQELRGFIRYEPGYVHALFSSIYVDPEYATDGIQQRLVHHVEEKAKADRRRHLVCFSKNLGDFLTLMGYDEIVVGEGLRLIGDTPQGRWLKDQTHILTREICYQKVLM